jgi:pimeloyl-ACP methyl ester carboxylesterase
VDVHVERRLARNAITVNYTRAWARGMIVQLMARLGYTRYGAQGGDWGGVIVRQLGLVDPEHVIGLHSNMCVASAPPGTDPNAGVPPEELSRVEAARARSANETAYSQLHGTKPQTLAYSLNDSPAGLAAWIVEKFRTWSDSGGDVEKRFTKDELLTNITIYWATETGPSSIRLYYENRRDPGLQGRVQVPFACAVFPFEMFVIAPRQ